LDKTLEWAIERMANAGFPVGSKVELVVDPELKMMGYARTENGIHYIVISDWALDSEMLGGLLLHELAHIYHTEKMSPSHRPGVLQEHMKRMVKREGLTDREVQALTDAFGHLQNMIVDDIAFACMTERELKLVAKFFENWVSDKPTGDAVVDATLLVRNAFAIASLKRRGLNGSVVEMYARNTRFLSFYNEERKVAFEMIEGFLENVKTDCSAEDFERALETYFDMVLGLMEAHGGLEDLR
jgi:hypothetical protein